MRYLTLICKKATTRCKGGRIGTLLRSFGAGCKLQEWASFHLTQALGVLTLRSGGFFSEAAFFSGRGGFRFGFSRREFPAEQSFFTRLAQEEGAEGSALFRDHPFDNVGLAFVEEFDRILDAELFFAEHLG